MGGWLSTDCICKWNEGWVLLRLLLLLLLRSPSFVTSYASPSLPPFELFFLCLRQSWTSSCHYNVF